MFFVCDSMERGAMEGSCHQFGDIFEMSKLCHYLE